MDSIVRFYSKISRTYDLMNYVVYSNRLLKKIIELAEIEKGNKVLDLACGTGWLSKVPEEEGLDIDLNGVDLTPEMLLKAKKGINGEFLVGKAEELPYKSGSFDVLLCNMAFSHFDSLATID
jgi:ubiquinone/menaquinone biosynthesis C-methylase UbiE